MKTRCRCGKWSDSKDGVNRCSCGREYVHSSDGKTGFVEVVKHENKAGLVVADGKLKSC